MPKKPSLWARMWSKQKPLEGAQKTEGSQVASTMSVSSKKPENIHDVYLEMLTRATKVKWSHYKYNDYRGDVYAFECDDKEKALATVVALNGAVHGFFNFLDNGHRNGVFYYDESEKVLRIRKQSLEAHKFPKKTFEDGALVSCITKYDEERAKKLKNRLGYSGSIEMQQKAADSKTPEAKLAKPTKAAPSEGGQPQSPKQAEGANDAAKTQKNEDGQITDTPSTEKVSSDKAVNKQQRKDKPPKKPLYEDAVQQNIDRIYLHILSEATDVPWRLNDSQDDTAYETAFDFGYTNGEMIHTCRRLNDAVFSNENDDDGFFVNGDAISIKRLSLDLHRGKQASLARGALVSALNDIKCKRESAIRHHLGLSSDIDLSQLFAEQVSCDVPSDQREQPASNQTTDVTLQSTPTRLGAHNA